MCFWLFVMGLGDITLPTFLCGPGLKEEALGLRAMNAAHHVFPRFQPVIKSFSLNPEP